MCPRTDFVPTHRFCTGVTSGPGDLAAQNRIRRQRALADIRGAGAGKLPSAVEGTIGERAEGGKRLNERED